MFSLASFSVVFIWMLVLVCPLYLVMANLLAKGIQILWLSCKNEKSYIYRYLGDLSWIFPLKEKEREFNLTHIILLANLIALVSLVIFVAIMWQNQQEKREIAEKREKRKINQD